jgi:co-chaperonin GroES (HSP10)
MLGANYVNANEYYTFCQGGFVKVIPLQNLVLLRLLPQPPVSKLIVVLSDTRIAKRAEVVAVGPEVLDLTVGNTVLFNSAAGMAIGDEVLVRESAVLGTL